MASVSSLLSPSTRNRPCLPLLRSTFLRRRSSRRNLVPVVTVDTVTTTTRRTRLRNSAVRTSALADFRISAPLISPSDHWATWSALLATAAFGIWSEKTKVGKALSGALVSTLVGLAATSLGVLSSEAPAYSLVLEYLLPLAVPLLLFKADLRRILKSTGKLLIAFLLGAGYPRVSSNKMY